DPNNTQAQAGLNDVLVLQNRAPRNTGLLGGVEARNQAIIEEVRYRFDTAIRDAQQAIADQRWADAQAAVTRAQLAAGSNRQVFTPQALREFDTTVAATQQQLRQAQEAAEADARARNDREQQRRIETERRQAEDQRQRTVADLKVQARRLT